MKFVFENYKDVLQRYKKNYHNLKTSFSLDNMQMKLNEILESRIPEFPKHVQLQLPKLKKVSDTAPTTEFPEIQLPKLKKL
jgi:hypothetical protein